MVKEDISHLDPPIGECRLDPKAAQILTLTSTTTKSGHNTSLALTYLPYGANGWDQVPLHIAQMEHLHMRDYR